MSFFLLNIVKEFLFPPKNDEYFFSSLNLSLLLFLHYFLFMFWKNHSTVGCSVRSCATDETGLIFPILPVQQLGRETIRVPVFIYREGEKGRESIWRLRSQWCDGDGQIFFFSRSTLFHRKMACNNNPDGNGITTKEVKRWTF